VASDQLVKDIEDGLHVIYQIASDS
jgi:hypothetical protein